MIEKIFNTNINLQKFGVPILATLLLVGCTKAKIVYGPQDFINPNRIVTEKIPTQMPTPVVAATFGHGNDPLIIKAYDEFTKKGAAKNIRSEGFVTFPYDAYSHPIVACAPLHLCVVQLERREKINNIDLGDSAHWLVGTSLIGTPQDGSYQIAVKPKLYDIATDMVVTTNKRTYNMGLVSKKGESTHVVNFYYPEETLDDAVKQLHQQEDLPLQKEIIDSSTEVDVEHINFNYNLSGNSPSWRPTRVFDDGNKTFIQMPPISERIDLPVLYILKNKQMEIVNYRYRRPYYIVDGLFARGYLISGTGHHGQGRVEIDNQNFGQRGL